MWQVLAWRTRYLHWKYICLYMQRIFIFISNIGIDPCLCDEKVSDDIDIYEFLFIAVFTGIEFFSTIQKSVCSHQH